MVRLTAGGNWYKREGDTVQVKLVQSSLGSEAPEAAFENLHHRVTNGRRMTWLDERQRFTTVGNADALQRRARRCDAARRLGRR